MRNIILKVGNIALDIWAKYCRAIIAIFLIVVCFKSFTGELEKTLFNDNALLTVVNRAEEHTTRIVEKRFQENDVYYEIGVTDGLVYGE